MKKKHLSLTILILCLLIITIDANEPKRRKKKTSKTPKVPKRVQSDAPKREDDYGEYDYTDPNYFDEKEDYEGGNNNNQENGGKLIYIFYLNKKNLNVNKLLIVF